MTMAISYVSLLMGKQTMPATESQSSAIKFWCVPIKGMRRAHLTLYIDGLGAGKQTLCNKDLHELQQTGSAYPISAPDNKICKKCLQLAGLINRPSKKSTKTPMDKWLDCLNALLK